MLRATLDFVATAAANATTSAATSFYQGAKNFVTDVNDYYHRQSNNLTQFQIEAAERKARNAKLRADLNRHKMFFASDHINDHAIELANFKKDIAEQLLQTAAELEALNTPYFLRFTRASAIKIKEQERDFLVKLQAAKTFASLQLLAQEQSACVLKNSPLGLLLDRITKPLSNEVIWNQPGSI